MNANGLIQNLNQEFNVKLNILYKSYDMIKTLQSLICKKAERNKLLSVLERDKNLREVDRRRCLKSMRDLSRIFTNQFEEIVLDVFTDYHTAINDICDISHGLTLS